MYPFWNSCECSFLSVLPQCACTSMHRYARCRRSSAGLTCPTGPPAPSPHNPPGGNTVTDGSTLPPGFQGLTTPNPLPPTKFKLSTLSKVHFKVLFFVSKGRDGSPFSADVAQGWKNTHLQMQLDLLCLFKFLNVQSIRGTIKGTGKVLI